MTACAKARQPEKVLELMVRMQQHLLVPDVTACAPNLLPPARTAMGGFTVRVRCRTTSGTVRPWRHVRRRRTARGSGRRRHAGRAVLPPRGGDVERLGSLSCAFRPLHSSERHGNVVCSSTLRCTCAGGGAALLCAYHILARSRDRSGRYSSAIKACQRAALERNVLELQHQAQSLAD